LALAAAVTALVAEAWPAVIVGLVTASVATLAYRRSRQTVMTDVELDELRSAEKALSTASNPSSAGQTLALAARELTGAAASTAIIEGIGPPVRVQVGSGTETGGDYGPGGR